ncbi:hypothetical protein ACJX0J_036131, partial [Zea mays]
MDEGGSAAPYILVVLGSGKFAFKILNRPVKSTSGGVLRVPCFNVGQSKHPFLFTCHFSIYIRTKRCISSRMKGLEHFCEFQKKAWHFMAKYLFNIMYNCLKRLCIFLCFHFFLCFVNLIWMYMEYIVLYTKIL